MEAKRGAAGVSRVCRLVRTKTLGMAAPVWRRGRRVLNSRAFNSSMDQALRPASQAHEPSVVASFDREQAYNCQR